MPELVLHIVLLLSGLFLLVKGGDFFVQGASAFAERLHISQIVIGLTIVSFGTSAPELVTSIRAAAGASSDLCYGNIIGSNIANILLILGIAGVIRPLGTKKNTVWKEIPFALLAAIALGVLVNDGLFNNSVNILSRGDSIILLLFFIIFLVYSFGISKVESQHVPDITPHSAKKITMFLAAGFTALLVGGELTVSNATALAAIAGVSEKMIGLTIVAAGTSLPELVTSAVAAYRGKTDIAIGNVIGSNIFNVFFILAVTGFIYPLPFQSVMNADLILLLVASAALFFTMFTGKRRTLDRWEALVFLLIYIIYTVYLILRS